MKIICPVIREGGSVYEIDGAKYQFIPQPDGEHVCDVTNEDHIELFLQRGFRMQRSGDAKQKAKPVARHSDQHPETITLSTGKSVTQVDVIAGILKDSGMTVDEWNAASAEERGDMIDAKLDAMDDAADNPDAADAERQQLAEQYQAKFGKKPHYKWSSGKIREELAKSVDDGEGEEG